MKVSIVTTRIPFVHGGAEYLGDGLGEKIRGRGHRDHVLDTLLS